MAITAAAGIAAACNTDVSQHRHLIPRRRASEINACRGDDSGYEQQEQKKGVEESVSFSPCRETLLVAVVVVCHVLRFCLCWWRMRVQRPV